MVIPASVTTIVADAGDDFGHMSWGDGWMWFWGFLMMTFWVLVIGGIIWAIIRSNRPGPADPHARAREVLADRYARGEITTEEYRERLDALR